MNLRHLFKAAVKAGTFGGVVLLVTASMAAKSADTPSAGTSESRYAYRTQAHDTLISISRRLLKDPQQWHALQTLNAIRDPRRVPVGSVILIPRDWLRRETDGALVIAVVGEARSAGSILKAGDSLSEGATIATSIDSYVTIKLADGSIIAVNPASSVVIEKLSRYPTHDRDTEIKLESGSAETQVKPQGEAGRFRIRTPVAISAVRGTEFRRAYDSAAGLDRTEVIGGRVAVGGAKSEVVVPSGYGSISDLANGPRRPVKLLPPPELSEIPAVAQDELVRFTFPPVTGAKGYRAQLASDAEFHLVVAESDSEAAEIAFSALKDGHYWLRVRSRDPDGLEGPNSVREFNRHLFIAPPRVTSTPIIEEPVVEKKFIEVSWNGEPGQKFLVQVARHPTFDTVVDERRVGTPRVTLPRHGPGSYFVRVQATDPDGHSSEFSQARRFALPLPWWVVAIPVVAALPFL